MKYFLILVIVFCCALFVELYDFETVVEDKSNFILRTGGESKIIAKVQDLQNDEFGYTQLMGYFDGKLPVSDMTLGNVVMKRSLRNMILGGECYEVFFVYDKRTIMYVSLTIESSEDFHINDAALVYSDPY